MYQYSFANVDLLVDMEYPGRDTGNNPRHFKVEGYGVGQNLITIMRRAPIATTTFGAYGTMVVNMQRILAGDLTFSVLMNSPENQYMQAYANYFQSQANSDGQLVRPIQVDMVDNMGKDTATLKNGVILAMPAMTRGQEINTVTWVLTFEEIVFHRQAGLDQFALGIETANPQ